MLQQLCRAQGSSRDGEMVPGSSVAVSSQSSETADKDVRKRKMKKARKAQIANGF